MLIGLGVIAFFAVIIWSFNRLEEKVREHDEE